MSGVGNDRLIEDLEPGEAADLCAWARGVLPEPKIQVCDGTENSFEVLDECESGTVALEDCPFTVCEFEAFIEAVSMDLCEPLMTTELLSCS